jgi:hypothetical protein
MDELVKRLRYCSKERDGCGMCALSSDCVLRVGLLTQAADAIEELSADCDMYRKGMTDEHNRAARLLWDKEHCWIPVAEQLPGPFENILVANKRGKHYDIDKGWWNGSFFDRCAKGGYHNVTHWRPLPQPPEEE